MSHDQGTLLLVLVGAQMLLQLLYVVIIKNWLHAIHKRLDRIPRENQPT